jgi:aspartate aminotransferase-like enzyme
MPKEKMVMIPGPTPVIKEIRDEMGREIEAFGDPRFVADFKTLITDLGTLLNCSGQTFVVAGTGTLAMEMAISNTTKRGDKILIVSNGFFGDRFIEICKRKGFVIELMQAEWGKVISAAEIDKKLAEGGFATAVVSHVDTSTGACAPVKEIGEVMKKYPDVIYIVDGVCATGAEPEDVDGMGIDILFTGSQKAFGVCPGLMMLWASKKAMVRRESLGEIAEYYCDFYKWLPIMEDTSKYFATPAVNLVWALKKSVELINEEGVQNRYDRHRKNAKAMQAALEALGLTVLAEPGCRAVTLSNLVYPDGIVDADFRAALYAEGVMVAGGLASYAGRMFRLGHMGHVDQNDMVTVLAAIERTLTKLGKKDVLGKGVAAYQQNMQ